ncbi:MAG: Gfo/Idh/MocA family oxidoreductase [Planctomycetes bacterium]|nr:Gfo/Idh/MocA family oxidoreductase [Planctomycetota bacterium]
MAIRIGFIGSGFITMHQKALEEIPEAEVVAICSRNEKKAREMIGENSIQYYPFDQYLNMLEKERLDAVYICLPPFMHGDIEVACSEHVKGLLIEKPVCIDLELGLKLNETFQKAGTIVSVGYMNRYRENPRVAAEFFKSSPAVLINGAWSGELPPPYWWRRKELSGGQMTEQCTHIIDAIRFIAGEFEEVQAFANKGFINDVDQFNVEDAITMNFRLKSGAIGNLQTSCFTRDHGGGALGIYLNIASREKSFRFENHAMDLSIQHSQNELEAFPSQEDALLKENQVFIDALQKGHHGGILSTYADSLETLKVSFAADRSLVEKRSVSI